MRRVGENHAPHLQRQNSRSSVLLDQMRVRARRLVLPLLLLVIPLQSWTRSNVMTMYKQDRETEVAREDVEQLEPQESDSDDSPDTERSALSLPVGLQVAVFDLAGTTLDDMVDGQPMAVKAIQRAFELNGLFVETADVTRVRGLHKREAIRRLCQQFIPPVDTSPANKSAERDELESMLVDKIFSDFNTALDDTLQNGQLQEVKGTSDTFKACRQLGIKIFIGSGFERKVMQEVVDRLGWEVDGIVAASRPEPDAILEAMNIAQVVDPQRVFKVGDTVADVDEGRNAGVWTVAVLTGTQSESDIRRAAPDFVIPSVLELRDLLPDPQYPEGETADEHSSDAETEDVPATAPDEGQPFEHDSNALSSYSSGNA